MKKTKTILILVIGALFIIGLFLFLRSKNPEATTPNLKPSQLNFSQSNELPSQPMPQTKIISENKVKVPSYIESLTPQEKNQWLVFESILKTKNDNDPRLDQDLKKLTPAFRQALYEKYSLLRPEDHNGRGLIVYLIAREISSNDDIQFLKKVYQDPPCLSMADCKSAAGNNDPHHSAMDQTTLIYEQLSGLYLIDKQLTQNPGLLNDATSRSGFIQILAQAESYPIPVIHEKARAIRTKYGL